MVLTTSIVVYIYDNFADENSIVFFHSVPIIPSPECLSITTMYKILGTVMLLAYVSLVKCLTSMT